MGYRIFFDNIQNKTCIINPKTHKRVFVYKDNEKYFTHDDNNFHEKINLTVNLCLKDRFNILEPGKKDKHKQVKRFSYGIISIEY